MLQASMRYWVYLDGQVAGPFDKGELASRLGPDTLLCPEDNAGDKPADWSKASALPEFSADFPAAARSPLETLLAQASADTLMAELRPLVSEGELRHAKDKAQALEDKLKKLEAELAEKDAKAQALQLSLTQKEFLAGKLSAKVQELERQAAEAAALRKEVEELRLRPAAAGPAQPAPLPPDAAIRPPSPFTPAAPAPDAAPAPWLGAPNPEAPKFEGGPSADKAAEAAPPAPEAPPVPVPGLTTPPVPGPAAGMKAVVAPSKGLKAPPAKAAPKGPVPAGAEVPPWKRPIFIAFMGLAVVLWGVAIHRLTSRPAEAPEEAGAPGLPPPPVPGAGAPAAPDAEAAKARSLVASYKAGDSTLGERLATMTDGEPPRNGRSSPWLVQRGADGEFLVDFYTNQLDPATDSDVVVQFSVDLMTGRVKGLNAPARALLTPPAAAPDSLPRLAEPKSGGGPAADKAAKAARPVAREKPKAEAKPKSGGGPSADKAAEAARPSPKAETKKPAAPSKKAEASPEDRLPKASADDDLDALLPLGEPASPAPSAGSSPLPTAPSDSDSGGDMMLPQAPK